MKLKDVTAEMISSITRVQANLDEEQVEFFVQAILQARRIVVFGAGRIGLMSRAFAMRLMHLGLDACFLGETTTPAAGPQDLLILNSSSGETPTVLEVARLAKLQGIRLASVTCQPNSSLARLADILLILPDGNPAGPGEGSLALPLKTAHEHNLLILLDAVAALLMDRTGQQPADLCNNLE